MVPDLVKHWRGKFFSDAAASKITAAGSADGQLERQPTLQTANRKFVRTRDPYNIPPPIWHEIGKDIAASAATFPASFGDPICDFAEHCHHMKAAEWNTFTFLLAPIYFKKHLPNEDYEELLNLIDALHLACDYILTEGEIKVIDQRLRRFYSYYERRYYDKKWERLPACLPVLHQVLHVARGIESAGPMFVYWQWPMERVCGMIAASAKSRVSANRNMAISILLNEQRNYLPYVVEKHEADEEVEDADGNVLLNRLFTRQLAEIQSTASRMVPRAATPITSQTRLSGRSVKGTLNHWQLMSVVSHLYQTGRTSIMLDDIPKNCVRWASYASPEPTDINDLESFVVHSHMMRRGNSTRDSTNISYESVGVEGSLFNFGQVLFFFTIEIPKEELEARPTEPEQGRAQVPRPNSTKTHSLAYIKTFTIERDGRLLFKSEKQQSKKIIIDVSAIRELIGLIKNGRRYYLIRRYTCLF